MNVNLGTSNMGQNRFWGKPVFKLSSAKGADN